MHSFVEQRAQLARFTNTQDVRPSFVFRRRVWEAEQKPLGRCEGVSVRDCTPPQELHSTKPAALAKISWITNGREAMHALQGESPFLRTKTTSEEDAVDCLLAVLHTAGAKLTTGPAPIAVPTVPTAFLAGVV